MKNKLCLSIETTSAHLGLSLVEFDDAHKRTILKTSFEEVSSRQSEHLIPTLTRLMRSARRKKEQLSLIAVDNGPGSFTGVRVGVAMGRTLAQTMKIPIVAVSSLEAMAWKAFGKKPGGLMVPVIPALTNEVYFAAFSGGQKKIKVKLSPRWKPNAVLESFLKKNKKEAVVVSAPPHPEAVAEVAIEKFRANPKSPEFYFENIEALYLQPSWAERSQKKTK